MLNLWFQRNLEMISVINIRENITISGLECWDAFISYSNYYIYMILSISE